MQYVFYDTLVHASNSAQYALGVNLSAVAQLLGVDETVLWSGTMNTIAQTGTVSENINSFNKIQIWARRNVNGLGRAGIVQEFYPTVNTDNNVYLYPVYTDMAANTLFQNMMYVTFTGNNFGLLRGWQKQGTNETTGVSAYGFNIEKIIGIGRKQ